MSLGTVRTASLSKATDGQTASVYLSLCFTEKAQAPQHELGMKRKVDPRDSVASRLSQRGAFGENVIRDYTSQVVAHLKDLHSQKKMHGNIKGANILVTEDGGRVRLADVGI